LDGLNRGRMSGRSLSEESTRPGGSAGRTNIAPTPGATPALQEDDRAEVACKDGARGGHPLDVLGAPVGALPLPQGQRYLVTGGGTGGHVYPAIAIADEIKRRDPTARFLYVGVKGKSEETIVPRRGYPLKFVHAEGWPGGRRPLALARFAIKLTLGLLKSIYLLIIFRPRMIIGSGGYVSAPIMLAAILLRRLHLLQARTFIHEQNTFPGKLNRLVGAMVDQVGVSFLETLRYFPRKGFFVGYPVRRELTEEARGDVGSPAEARGDVGSPAEARGDVGSPAEARGDVGSPAEARAAARQALGIPPEKKVVFAFGGSQGARTINRALVGALPHLKERADLFIVHGTGAYKGPGYDAQADTEARLGAIGLGDDPNFYLRQSYFHNIEQVYAAADLVVCRGGAGTLTEIAARAIPCLVVPKANLPGDHQVKNARALSNAGAARVIYERVELTEGGLEERVKGRVLAEAILALLEDPAALEDMRQAARVYHQPGSLDRIGNALARLMDPAFGADRTAAQKIIPREPNGPDLEALGPIALIRYLERRRREGEGPLEPSDQEYLEYRTDDYLASPAWPVRNRGVKLVGLLGYTERLEHLLYMLKERRPVPWLYRLLGGDFEQVGFIRRNIFAALRQLDVSNQGVWDAIQLGLEDGYFEVRTEAARAAGHFAGRLGNAQAQVVAQLRRRLKDRSFEVVAAAAEGLGKTSSDGAIVEDFKIFLFDKNWKIRKAVVEALHRLLEREVVHPGQLEPILATILITSNGFVPQFPLKQALLRLGQAMNRTSPRSDRSLPEPEDEV